MNVTHPLKYHSHSYRKPYFLYTLIFFIFLFVSIISFRHLDNFYKYLSATILLITLVFTTITAIYEFTILINHYLSLKTIKVEFLISSIIFSVQNALIQLALVFISYLVIKGYNPEINQVFALNNFSVYSFTFVLHLAVFANIGILSLLLKNIKYVQLFLYTIVLIVVGLISFEITNTIINFVYSLYANTTLLIQLNPIIILITIGLWCLIHLKINMNNK